jgi:FkbM family methyltransferase
MINKVIDLLRCVISKRRGRKSYAQSGEDLIFDFIFQALQIERPTYLDVGANDPYLFSNSYFFYKLGSKGVTVEPDPDLHRRLMKERPKEKHLNVGVAAIPTYRRPFFVMSTPTLNTFSELEARRYENTGHHKIVRIDEVDVITIEGIFDTYFDGLAPNLLSIDVEGLDFEIISSINFNKYRPTIICIETLTFSESRSEVKVDDIRELMTQNEYIVYADTYINTIFLDKKKWVNR